jgi:hypothetical protein
MRWFLSERLAKTIRKPISKNPMAKVMKCSPENGWKGFAGMFLVRTFIYQSGTEQ